VFAIGLSVALFAAACRTPPPSPAEAIRQGDELAGKKDYRQAIAAYRIAVEGDPTDGAARLKLANAYVSAGQWADAAPEAIRAADLLPNDSSAQLLAISMLLAQKQFMDAASRAALRLEQDPNNADLLVLFGNAKARLPNSWFALFQLEEAFREGGNYDGVLTGLRPLTPSSDDTEAAGAFRKALQLTPHSTGTLLAFANFCWAVGRPEDSEEALKRAARQNDVLANRALGQYYVKTRRYAEAETYLKAGTALGDRDTRLALADFYVRAQRDQEALQVLLPLAAAEDPAHRASLRAAEIEIRVGNGERARPRIDGILNAQPRHLKALILKARYLLSIRDIDQAIGAGRSAVDVDPGSADARLMLARALSAKGESEEAFEQFAQVMRLQPSSTESPKELLRLGLVLGRHAEALAYGRQALRQDPNDDTTQLGVVKALIRTQDIAAADQALRPLLAKHPSSPEILVALGAIQGARGQREAAAATYQRALQSDRDSFEAVAGIVNLALEDKRFPTARERAEQARAAHPDHPGYALLAARVAVAAGDARSAEAHLQRVRQLEPNNLTATLLLAEVLTAQNRGSEAERLLAQWLERRPSAIEADIALARLLETIGRPKEARARYEGIVAKNPGAATAAARLAALYVQSDENPSLALTLAAKAKSQLPNDAEVSDVLGWVYVHNDLPKLGIPHLEDAVRAAPANPIYRYHLGIAYYRAEMPSKAREELTKALGLAQSFPGSTDAERTLELLRRR
jgi:tetratricopeptide (TPR) repeat protein